MISESLFTAIFGAVSAETEDSLVHVARAAVRAGYALVPNRPGTKQPMCTLNATEAKRADEAARTQAQANGVKRWDRVRHECGVHEAITDEKTSDRVVRRLLKNTGRINLGIELRRSRVLVVDVDTPAEAAAFRATWEGATPEPFPGSYTITSPGVQAADGTWVHSGGGHYYFTLPEHIARRLPAQPGVLKDEGGWATMWAGQVLVPPSVRAEGAYRLTGEPRPAPEWLLHRVLAYIAEHLTRRREQAQRTAERIATGTVGDAAVDTWSADTDWDELLVPAGWTETGDATECGCPEWTAPGVHANPKSATAHEPGCTKYDDSPGHAPLHIWTDNPPEPFEPGGTYTKLQFVAIGKYGSTGGQAIAATCRDLGIAREGGSGSSLTPLAVRGLLSRASSSPAPETPLPATATAEQHTANGRAEYPEPAGGAGPSLHPLVPGAAGPDAPAIPAPHVSTPEDTAAEDAVALELARRVARHLAEQQFEASHADELDELERLRAHRRQKAADLARQELANERAGTAAFADELYDEADLDEMPELEPLVHGWINKDSDVRVYGPSGHGKSFAVLDLALCIANGTPWHGIPVEQGRVLYIAGEGARGIKKRIRSWRARFGGTPVRGQLTVKGRPVQLSAPEQLISAAEENAYALVIVDTQARSTVGLEENSASDTAIITEAMRRIRQAGDKTTVMLVHHTGKDEDAGARGSSAGTAAMDTEIEVKKKNAIVSLRIAKQKDGADGITRDFALTAVPATDSCVLLPMDPMTAATAAGENGHRPITPLTGTLGLPEGPMVAEVATLFREKYERDPGGGFTIGELRGELLGGVQGRVSKDRRRQQINRAFERLRGDQWVVAAEENVSQRENGKHRWRGPEDDVDRDVDSVDRNVDTCGQTPGQGVDS